MIFLSCCFSYEEKYELNVGFFAKKTHRMAKQKYSPFEVQMRLSQAELNSIVAVKNEVFGAGTKIYLFGSRVDVSQKGGDIDLYIEYTAADKFDKRVAFLTRLEKEMGEQKIDVVFSSDATRLIELEAKKGIELDLTKIKIRRYLNQCDRHLQRVEEAYGDIASLLPLSVERFKVLEKNHVQAIDQYLFRFAKLQDTMGEKLFKLIVQEYEPEKDAVPFIDVLNSLEKLGLIASAKEWMTLRKIRNEISHQYDDEPEEMSQAINHILNQKNIIKEIYLKLKGKVEFWLGN